MNKCLSQIWQRFRTSFSVGESLNTTVETGKAVLEAAKTFQEQGASVELLKPLLQNSSSLLDVLCSPLEDVLKVFGCDFRHLLIPPNPLKKGGQNQSPPIYRGI